MSKRPMDNGEFFAEIMNNAKTGPILTLCVISAVDNYSKAVAEMPVDELQKELGPMVDAASWKAACEELQEVLAARFDRFAGDNSRFMVDDHDEEEEQ